MTNDCYLALGSNIGDREYYLRQAVCKLRQHKSLDPVRLSSIYETEPVGVTGQPAFLNMVLHLKTELTPGKVLETTQSIEQGLDRVRHERWGPRTIDLDILLYNDENIKMNELYIPHPRMHERAFVLIPLNEIAAAQYVSNYKQTIQELTDQLSGREKEGVRLWRKCSGRGGFGLFEN
ncbi:2-amino-4-hydroxy-6-hydroxymethyldihydropteridine diphosphokinase [Salibacterium aidingense]|uniref:2-amino-4-hydroxy-6- hydroxymethyldihydropteridine diphosphokinase n=1 Tax=Salibacterium aidingense TaxID=384933 RepID=UPI00040BCEAA|nr:2-amino-4-hydroxy-6-hydroxymethyldihydropteridine diphosphokinase [Salibacterium aidingense]